MSLEIAKAGMKKVAARWGSSIPPESLRFEADDIFRFHRSDSSFMSAFTMTFEVLFKKANGLQCPADQIGSGCGAFVTPTQSLEARLIHVHPGNLSREFDPLGLLSHEYIHFLSHPAFYPKFYGGGGDNPFRVEGATEWLNLQCYTDFFEGLPAPTAERYKETQNRYTRSDRAAYKANYQKIKAWVAADTGNAKRLANFVFKGIPADLSSVHG